jgi:enoyl-CoA hydratase/carnithine racemase
MPTVALINGHAFAGAFMTAMYHDYRVFNPSRGYLCLNEIDFGVPLKPPMSAIFRDKLSPQVYRTIVLEAKRIGGPEALKEQIVDVLGGMDETMELIASRKLFEKGATNVYHLMKAEMYRDTLVDLDDYHNSERMVQQKGLALDHEAETAEARVEHWETKSKSKL